MPEPQQKSFERQVARKTRISDIALMQLDESSGSRVNVIATLVHKADEAASYGSAMIDDGTASVSLRSFENRTMFSNVDIGDSVLIIGKIREFNNERYIMPEILKKLGNLGWINVRKAELGSLEPNVQEPIQKEQGPRNIKNEESVKDEEPESGTYQGLHSIISSLDSGDGAPIEKVIEQMKGKFPHDPDSLINGLLENGEIFEVRPGRIKVLE